MRSLRCCEQMQQKGSSAVLPAHASRGLLERGRREEALVLLCQHAEVLHGVSAAVQCADHTGPATLGGQRQCR